MDRPRGRLLHSHRNYKTRPQYNYYHENINRSLPSSSGFYQTSGFQRQTLKWKKDYYYRGRGNHRSRPCYKKNDMVARKSNKPEDVEEEERKKKLSDTAKKLLSKIKTWNSGNNCNQVDSENCSEEINNLGDKPKRIAHAKKVKLASKATRKSCLKPVKKKTTYDVNKETVKDFQSRIQHKLMEEIMQMPKENLQNVLNDPKINPIMELKMSRLVRENRLLIAHKLRAIAESKMKTDCPSNPQFLEDIDKLIDPVIESDLSVLPYELIKQMEDIFQVQFDYSHNNEHSLGETGVSGELLGELDVAVENGVKVDEGVSQLEKNIKVENNEDLSLYECSTDEDEENSAGRFLDSSQGCNLNEEGNGEIFNGTLETPEGVAEFIADQKITFSENEMGGEEKSLENLSVLKLENNFPSQGSSGCPTPDPSLPEQFSVSCQTDCSCSDSSTQTLFHMVDSLYGAPLPKEAVDDSFSSLLEEVNLIQNLVNKLNERRFMIFLQLAKINPSGSFADCDVTKTNFIETVSNSNQYLVDALKLFFNNRQNILTEGKKKKLIGPRVKKKNYSDRE